MHIRHGSTKWEVLDALHTGEANTVPGVVEYLGVSQQTTSGHLHDLESVGFVQREPGRRDPDARGRGRAPDIWKITKTGRRAMREAPTSHLAAPRHEPKKTHAERIADLEARVADLERALRAAIARR